MERMNGHSPTPAGRHRPFVLVLGGGGVRGFAHVGVLRYLAHLGYTPSAIVGVSMGAVVGATYALRDDWYQALLSMDTGRFPTPVKGWKEAHGAREKLHALVGTSRAVWDLVFAWGVGVRALGSGFAALRDLVGDRRLDEGRIPVATCSTDLMSGERIVATDGPAADAVYASVALAGVFPPLEDGDRLLADGAYSDVAPVDVAREWGDAVIAVDPSQDSRPTEIRYGYQAIMRATEICFMHHAHQSFAQADLVLRPRFGRYVDTLDFAASRMCVAAGVRAARRSRDEIARLLSRPSAPL